MERRQGSEKDNTISLLQATQKGDRNAREQLIQKFLPLLNKVLSEFLRRFVSQDEDEYSIGLMALDEAVTTYDENKGSSFPAFCRLVIRRRLIDHLRSSINQARREIVNSSWETANDTLGETELPWTWSQSQKDWLEKLQAEERAEEIKRLDEELHSYQITFADLADCAPKQLPARRRAAEIAEFITTHRHLLQLLQQKKTLPAKELKKLGNFSAKILERQRRYIIALTIILSGDYPCLNYYIKSLFKEVGE